MVDFTGTTEEKVFKSKIHQILLLNELGGVEASAYQLGIGNGKSGYSFGYCRRSHSISLARHEVLVANSSVRCGTMSDTTK